MPSIADYTCAFQCGFDGSFEIVSAHEANCALNPQNYRQMPLHASPLHASRTPPGKEPDCPKPAKQIQGSSLSSDVSTYRQALSSTHSIDTPTNILEISNQPEPQNYRRVPLHASSGFGQFEKAGPQTPPASRFNRPKLHSARVEQTGQRSARCDQNAEANL